MPSDSESTSLPQKGRVLDGVDFIAARAVAVKSVRHDFRARKTLVFDHLIAKERLPKKFEIIRKRKPSPSRLVSSGGTKVGFLLSR